MRASPRGSVVRSIPDFFPDRLSQSGTTVGTVAISTFAQISLFNNSPTSNTLVVWDLSIKCQGVAGQPQPAVARMAILGGSVGTLFNVPHPLVAGGVLGDGQIYQQNPYTPPGGEDGSFALAPDAYNWSHEWPVCILRPGYRLGIDTDFNPCTVFIVNFIWETVTKV